MILFVCETFFQLLNAVNIKEQCYKEEKADLVLTESSDFSQLLKALKNIGTFENIILFDFVQERDREELKININKYISGEKKYKNLNDIKEEYSDYFMPVDTSLFQKLIYYKIVCNGYIPKVHIFEEGMLTYFQDVLFNLKNDGIKHGFFPDEKRLCNNIDEILVYDPDLFSGSNYYQVNRIPKIDPEISQVIKVFNGIFGECHMPKEKYIYLAEPFAVEGLNNDEMTILDGIADIVGKENIIVKLHPRMDSGIYESNGYKTFVETKKPWELFVLHSEFEKKILITVSSGAAITSKLLYNNKYKVIYLYRIMALSLRYHVKHKCFPDFFKKVYQLFNEEEKNLFCPNSVLELKMTIKYLEGET